MNRRALGAAAAVGVLGGAGLFALLDTGSGIDLTAFTLTDTVNVTGAAGVAVCELTMTDADGVAVAGCVLKSPLGRKTSCITDAPSSGVPTSGTWTCSAPLEADTEDGAWKVEYLFANDTVGNRSKWTYAAMLADIWTDPDLTVTVTSTNQDITPPTISSFTALPALVDPGDPVTCTITADGTGTAVRDVGCTFTSATEASLTCVGPSPSCDLAVPVGADAGATWTEKSHFAVDSASNRTIGSTGVTFGTNACTPDTCGGLSLECGSGYDDGCGGTLDCGACTPAYANTVCNAGTCECTPDTCGGLSLECGSGYDDNCGGTLDCGACTPSYANTVCNAGTCECTPDADCNGGAYECGTDIDDGCNGFQSCGSCGPGETCSDSPNYLCVPDVGTSCDGYVADTSVTGPDGWQTSSAKTTVYQDLTFNFWFRSTNDVTANAGVGLSQTTPVTAWSQLAATLRVSGNEIQVHDGTGVYSCDTPCPTLIAGQWYQAQFTVDVPGRIYSVSVGACDQPLVEIAANRTFRNGTTADTLAYYGIWDVPGDTFEVRDGTWNAQCTPETCVSLGNLDCDVWDNGCGGTVDCGTCTLPDVCTAGICGAQPIQSNTFPLALDGNGRTFNDKNGSPWLLHGDTAWGLIENLCAEGDCGTTGGATDSIDDYLNDVQAKGFNAIIATSPEGYFTSHSPPYDDAYSDSPFQGSPNFNISTGINTSSPYWTHLEYVLNAANDRDILVLLAPFYGGFSNSEGWQDYWGTTSQTDLVNYADWYCNRFGVYPNIMYSWGNDISTATWSSNATKINAMANACAAADPDAFHMFHGRQSIAYASYTNLQSQGWLSARGFYGSFSDMFSVADTEYTASPSLPTFLFEGNYENNPSAPTAEQQRSQYWLGALSGGRAGVIYGNENIWTGVCNTAQCNSFRTGGPTAWVTSLGDTVRVDMQYLKSVLESVSWKLLEPTSSTANNAYATASDGSAIVAYTVNGASFNINTSALTDTDYTCVWYDPTNGNTDTCTGGTQGAATSFSHVANNAAGGDGWALVVLPDIPVATRGPTGQWPSATRLQEIESDVNATYTPYADVNFDALGSFPPYTTAAELSGTSNLAGLLTNAACANGCVIEYAGNISGTFTSRAGTGCPSLATCGPILVRPPINERADFTINATISGDGMDNILMAGYAQNGGQLQVISGADNSGFAWIEGTGGFMQVLCYGTDNTSALFFEIVGRNMQSVDDRFHPSWGGGTSGQCTTILAGSYLSGDIDPDPDHSDTVQQLNSTPRIVIVDSILRPSWDKVFQSEQGISQASLGGSGLPIWMQNVWSVAPGYGSTFWGDIPGNFAGRGTLASADIFCDGCTVAGSITSGSPSEPLHSVACRVQNSETYALSNCNNLTNNTTVGSIGALTPPPPFPTHTQLDTIWSP